MDEKPKRSLSRSPVAIGDENDRMEESSFRDSTYLYQLHGKSKA